MGREQARWCHVYPSTDVLHCSHALSQNPKPCTHFPWRQGSVPCHLPACLGESGSVCCPHAIISSSIHDLKVMASKKREPPSHEAGVCLDITAVIHLGSGFSPHFIRMKKLRFREFQWLPKTIYPFSWMWHQRTSIHFAQVQGTIICPCQLPTELRARTKLRPCLLTAILVLFFPGNAIFLFEHAVLPYGW